MKSAQTTDGLGAASPVALEAMIADLRALAASAAHELNGPLAAIRSSAELLLEETHPPHVRDLLEIIVRQVDSASERANSLLATARGSYEPGTVDEVALVAEAADAAIREIGTRINAGGFPYKLTTSTRIDRSLHVALSPIALTQIFENLLWNAAKYGGPRARIEADREVDAVSIVISDDGDGIPEDVRTRVFEPFARGTNTGGAAGTGVGLATVATLARRCGGSVQLVDSGPAGTIFELRLPFASAGVDASRAGRQVADREPRHSSWRSRLHLRATGTNARSA